MVRARGNGTLRAANVPNSSRLILLMRAGSARWENSIASISHELAQPITVTTARCVKAIPTMASQRDPPDLTEVRIGMEKIMGSGHPCLGPLSPPSVVVQKVLSKTRVGRCK